MRKIEFGMVDVMDTLLLVAVSCALNVVYRLLALCHTGSTDLRHSLWQIKDYNVRPMACSLRCASHSALTWTL